MPGGHGIRCGLDHAQADVPSSLRQGDQGFPAGGDDSEARAVLCGHRVDQEFTQRRGYFDGGIRDQPRAQGGG